MSKVCNINSNEIENILNELNENNRKEIIFKSLVKGGNELVKETKRELKKSLPQGATSGNRYGTPMESGVKLKKDKDYDEVKVHIMGDYRLKFFEMGTDERYLKKPLKHKEDARYKYRNNSDVNSKPYRGKISPKHFFKNARENNDAITDEILNNIINEINKIIK